MGKAMSLVTVMFDETAVPSRFALFLGDAPDDWVRHMTVPTHIMRGPYPFTFPPVLGLLADLLIDQTPNLAIETDDASFMTTLYQTVAFGWNSRRALASKIPLQFPGQPEMTSELFRKELKERAGKNQKIYSAFAGLLDTYKMLPLPEGDIRISMTLVRQVWIQSFGIGFLECSCMQWEE
jgi:hypothetical protein